MLPVIELPVFRFGLRLTLQENALIGVCVLPYVILWHFSQTPLLREGILWLPALVTMACARYYLVTRKYPEPLPAIRCESDAIWLPAYFTTLGVDTRLRLVDIQSMICWYSNTHPLWGKGRKIIAHCTFFDSTNRKVAVIRGFETDLSKIEAFTSGKHVPTIYKNWRVRFGYAGLAVALIMSIIAAGIYFGP